MSIPGDASPLLLGGGGTQQYKIERSLRFNSSDSAYCSRVFSSAGNRKTWTWAAWVKRSQIGSGDQALFTCISGTSNTTYFALIFRDDTILIGGGTNAFVITTQVFRDPSAWYHIVLAVDTTQASASNTLKLYVNGSEVTAFSTDARSSYTSSSVDLGINQALAHDIGRNSQSGGNQYFSGYLADVHFIDGQALTPSSFAETNITTGQWVPKAYTGTYGTNGFRLAFADNSNNTATTLGKDSSPNGNNWTPINLAVANFRSATLTRTGGAIQTLQDAANAFDGVLSTSFICEPSNPSSLTLTLATGQAFSTLEINGYVQGSSKIIINGVDISSQLVGDPNVYRTITGVTSPFTTLFMEVTGGASIPVIRDIRFNGVSPGWIFTGSDARSDSLVDTPTSGSQVDTGLGGQVTGNYCTLNPLSGASSHPLGNGNLEKISTSGSGNRFGTIGITSGKFYWENAFTVIGSAVASCGISSNGRDANNISELKVYETPGTKYNGSSSSAYGASWGANDVIGIAFDADNGTLAFYKNGVSQGTAFTGLTGLTWFPVFRDDGGYSGWINFGQRPFAYTAPSGFKALCDTNLPAPVVAKPNTVFDVVLRTASGSSGATISGLNFSPDFIWSKLRNTAVGHYLVDTNRGLRFNLRSNDTTSELDYPTFFTSVTSTGYTVGNFDYTAGSSVVEWCWDAGSSTATNTQGSITSQVRANASAGFSIVTYTGTSSSQSVGHGLNVAPSLIITKNRSAALSWGVYHSSLGANNYLVLDVTNAVDTAAGIWGTVSSSVFGIANFNINGKSNPYVAYCFAPVAGYSSAFSFTGNGSTDGPMVWLGFRPRLILYKCSSAAYNWFLVDTARDTYNVAGLDLLPNSSAAESDDRPSLDILSNGFKVRNNYASQNGNGATFVGFAWAENPFQYARAR